MRETLAAVWPWYVAGPLIGLMPALLLYLGNRPFGLSSNFRHLCAAVAPCGRDYFRYDWKGSGGWNLAFAAGIFAGAFAGTRLLGPGQGLIAEAARADLAAAGVRWTPGLVPAEVFSWANLFTAEGLLLMVGGGLCVGFGASYAGGCTSGHGIAGLADLQPASLIALLGFFAGGLFATWVLLPAIL